jgi:hypothetical protein
MLIQRQWFSASRGSILAAYRKTHIKETMLTLRDLDFHCRDLFRHALSTSAIGNTIDNIANKRRITIPVCL